MRQVALLVGTFVVTLSVLTGGWYAYRNIAAKSGGLPSGSPAVAVASLPLRSEAAISPAGPEPTPSVQASRSPDDSPTATPDSGPAVTPATTRAPSSTRTVTVTGIEYARKEIPDNVTLTPGADGSIVMAETGSVVAQATLEYRVPADAIPAGKVISRVDAALCGAASGQFWETYGPYGADPVEYEGTQPGPDSCWHYTGGDGSNTTVSAIIQGNGQFRITKVVYVLTLAG